MPARKAPRTRFISPLSLAHKNFPAFAHTDSYANSRSFLFHISSRYTLFAKRCPLLHRLYSARNFRNFARDGRLAHLVEGSRVGVRHFVPLVRCTFHSNHARGVLGGL